jgi:glycosyltransferase involved in cell wall biosynthesis
MLTVVMPTHNGADTLSQALSAFCGIEPPIGSWKLVVVDNGSTDSSRSIIESFKSRLPLTYVFERVLGKSTALNTGIEHISGDIVVFTDDDVLPKPDWLAQMRAAADLHPEFSLFGGCIVPHWAVPPEDWILKIDQTVLAITGPTWNEGPIASTLLFGPNMAVRTNVLEAGYRFDTSLGPAGSRYRMGEDSDFVQRLGHAGFRAWHCKRAVVAHMIRREQMTKDWVLRRAFPSGRVSYRREFSDRSESPALLLGLPRYMIREILEQGIRWGRATLLDDQAASFKERWRLHFLTGRAAEARDLLRTKNAPGA